MFSSRGSQPRGAASQNPTLCSGLRLATRHSWSSGIRVEILAAMPASMPPIATRPSAPAAAHSWSAAVATTALPLASGAPPDKRRANTLTRNRPRYEFVSTSARHGHRRPGSLPEPAAGRAVDRRVRKPERRSVDRVIHCKPTAAARCEPAQPYPLSLDHTYPPEMAEMGSLALCLLWATAAALLATLDRRFRMPGTAPAVAGLHPGRGIVHRLLNGGALAAWACLTRYEKIAVASFGKCVHVPELKRTGHHRTLVRHLAVSRLVELHRARPDVSDLDHCLAFERAHLCRLAGRTRRAHPRRGGRLHG